MPCLTRFVFALFLAAPLTLVQPLAAAPKAEDILATYADIAAAVYEDSLSRAEELQAAVEALVTAPSQSNLDAARLAWRLARIPYQQSEALRFGNALVDDWEGRVNAWPLDEGLIDYVAGGYGSESDANPLYAVNVVANRELRIGPDLVDASVIDAALIAEVLHEAQEVEANVASGYHAIEFLLWGQDLNGTEAGAGSRPVTDFDRANCTNGNCDRRGDYLVAATQLLVSDLADMAAMWGEGGEARADLMAKGPEGGLAAILTGLGSLSYGELAGERMKLGLILHDPEEEHDCFSDNTHNSHYYDQAGIVAFYTGHYARIDGRVVSGPSLADLAADTAPEAGQRVLEALAVTTRAMQAMKDTADGGIMAYDQMIGAGNADGNALVQAAIDGLVAQTRALEGLVSALGLAIEVEGSDSLDNPTSVQ